MSARVRYRLRLTNGMTLECSRPADADDVPFAPHDYGVVHIEDSLTGKRGGDVTIFPWHTVEELVRWRTRS